MDESNSTSVKRYFIHLAYLGTNYRGWQWQKNAANTLQHIIENALLKMFHTPITIFGCGRTDAGVHAQQYFCHIETNIQLDYNPIQRINYILPKDITVYDWIEVSNSSHARYDATVRTYRYYCHEHASPFIDNVSFNTPLNNVNIEFLHQALEFIQKQKNFANLCLTPLKHKNTYCHIYQAAVIVSNDKNQLYFEFSANRFLKSMIRLIVARLIALANSNITLQEFADQSLTNLELKIKSLAPPHALHLVKVEYPYLRLDTKMPTLIF